MKWILETLNDKVDQELDALDPSFKAKFLHIAGLLEEFGPEHVREPHCRSFVKKTQKTPNSAIATAMKRLKEVTP